MAQGKTVERKRDSSWKIEESKEKSYPKLKGNIEADVLIVGAGLAGLMNAYMLSKAGKKVVVLERFEKILHHVTLYTTAFITEVVDTSFSKLVRMFGEDKAKLVWQSGEEAIAFIKRLVEEENISCEFKSVSFFTCARDKKDFKNLEKEYKAIKRSGLEVRLQESGGKLGFTNAGYMEIPGQAMFHPIKFAQALAEMAESLGAKIYSDSEVLEIENLTGKTDAGQVTAKDIIIATYSPILREGTRFKKGTYRSYVEELEISRGAIPEGMYVDMRNPYHYFRVDNNEEHDPIRAKDTLRALATSNGTSRMIVGGEDHRKEIKINPDKNFKALEQYAATIIPGGSYRLVRKWASGVLESVDGLPLIGAIMPHVYVATAFSGNGMTYAAVSAVVIRDLIIGDKNPYIELYNPKRTLKIKALLTKGRDYMGEFFGGAFKNLFS